MGIGINNITNKGMARAEMVVFGIDRTNKGLGTLFIMLCVYVNMVSGSFTF